MLDARRLATLQAILDTGSFAAAADALGYTQSAVSQHVAELERSAGLRLLERRPVRPTAAGLVALRAAGDVGRALAAGATELAALREGRAGHVRLAAFASAIPALAAPALAALRASHPGLSVSVAQLETPAAHSALIAGEADLAITFDYDREPRRPPPEVARAALADDPLLAALPARHRLARRRAVALRDLAGDPWVDAPGAGLPQAVLRDVAGRAGFEPGVGFTGDDFRAVLALVAAGLGVAVLPRLALHALPDGVVARPLRGEPLVRRLYLARLATDAPAPAADALSAAIAARA